MWNMTSSIPFFVQNLCVDDLKPLIRRDEQDGINATKKIQPF